MANGEESQWSSVTGRDSKGSAGIPHSPGLHLAPYHRQMREVGVLQGGHLGLLGNKPLPEKVGRSAPLSLGSFPEGTPVKSVWEIRAGCSQGSAEPRDSSKPQLYPLLKSVSLLPWASAVPPDRKKVTVKLFAPALGTGKGEFLKGSGLFSESNSPKALCLSKGKPGVLKQLNDFFFLKQKGVKTGRTS